MRHRRRRYKLGRKTAHRKATLENIAASLFRHGRITTTLAKAKAVQRLAERIITLAKRGDLHATRQITARLGDRGLATKLVKEIAPAFRDRKGGYTRTILYKNRMGDGAPLVLLELSHYVEPVKVEKEKKKAKKEKPQTAEPPKEAKEPKEKKKKGEGEEKEAAKPSEPTKEEAKPGRGGFLSGLRKFLTGEEKQKNQ